MPESNYKGPRPWGEYYRDTAEEQASQGIVEVVNNYVQSGLALDLGSGAGRDTRFLASKGFEVTAVDNEEASREFIEKLNQKKNVRFVRSTFEEYDFPPNHFDIINSNFALPFNPPVSFEEVITKLKGALKPKGVFVGNLFGDKDEWNRPASKMTFHTKAEVDKLLEGFIIIKLQEVDNPIGRLADGRPKHWHMFNIIAQKPE